MGLQPRRRKPRPAVGATGCCATFDAALSQLVLSFVTDADQVASEMRRVVRPDGVVGACMWLEGEALRMGQIFWESAATVDPGVSTREGRMAFRKQGDIADLWKRTGLRDVEETFLDVRARYESFDDFWDGIATAAGAIGSYMVAAGAARRDVIREACRARLGDPRQGFELAGRACAARGKV